VTEYRAKRCEECGDLYHPSGNWQRYCVRPACIEQRGDRLSDYEVTSEKQRTWRAARSGKTAPVATAADELLTFRKAMIMPLTLSQAQSLPGRAAVDSTGEKAGTVGVLFTSNTTGEPEWVTLKYGIFGGKENFAPLTGAVINSAGDLALAVPLSLIREAPSFSGNDSTLTSTEVTRLYRHYGITGTPAANVPPGTGTGTFPVTGSPVGSAVPDPEPVLQRYVVTEETRQVGKEPI
jgi:hypothetical protein